MEYNFEHELSTKPSVSPVDTNSLNPNHFVWGNILQQKIPLKNKFSLLEDSSGSDSQEIKALLESAEKPPLYIPLRQRQKLGHLVKIESNDVRSGVDFGED